MASRKKPNELHRKHEADKAISQEEAEASKKIRRWKYEKASASYNACKYRSIGVM